MLLVYLLSAKPIMRNIFILIRCTANSRAYQMHNKFKSLHSILTNKEAVSAELISTQKCHSSWLTFISCKPVFRDTTKLHQEGIVFRTTLSQRDNIYLVRFIMSTECGIVDRLMDQVSKGLGSFFQALPQKFHGEQNW